jgi:hypothetical protein
MSFTNDPKYPVLIRGINARKGSIGYVNAFAVWRTVTVYENGKKLRSKTYCSHYATITGMVLRGKGAVAPKPAPAPSP